MRHLALWIFIFSTPVLRCHGQNLQQSMATAARLYDQGEFALAADLYRRVIFFDDEETYDSISFSMLALSQFQLGKYDQAARHFGLAFKVSRDSRFHGDMVLSYLMNGDLSMAKLELLNFQPDSRDDQVQKLLLASLVDFKRGEFENAEKSYQQVLDLLDLGPEHQQMAIAQMANKVIRRRGKQRAQIMSLFLPGSGQIYNGEIRDGVNSAVITSLFATLYVSVALSLTIVDAIIVVLPWYQKYYVGGYNNAGRIALSKQEIELNKIFNRMLVQYDAYMTKW